jgi:GT2 family glycosyltransferase
VPGKATQEVPPVAIALLNWNKWEDTIECLETVAQLRYGDLFVVLVDNGSQNDSLRRIEEWARARSWTSATVQHDADSREVKSNGRSDVRLLLIQNSRNVGFAGGTNLAIRYALQCARTVRYVWALNTDTLVKPTALVESVSVMQSRADIGSVQSVLVRAADATMVDSTGIMLRARGGARDAFSGQPVAKFRQSVANRSAIEIFGCCAAAALYDVEALKVAGLFDETFWAGHEDVDLACRLQACGFAAMLAVRSVVLHHGGVSRHPVRWGIRGWRSQFAVMRVVARWYPRSLGAVVLLIRALRSLMTVIGAAEVRLSEWVSALHDVWSDYVSGVSAAKRRDVLRKGRSVHT